MVELEAYRDRYPAREPDLRNMQNADETQDLSDDDLVLTFSAAPVKDILCGQPGRIGDKHGQHKYLWVVRSQDVPAAEEGGPLGKRTARKYLSHTNLTGGQAAHVGGEMWFKSETEFWLNGASSRYGPRTAEELSMVVAGFVAAGFKVASFGFDDEAGVPRRVLRGKTTWESLL